MKLLHKTVINVSAAEFKVDYKGTSPEAGNLAGYCDDQGRPGWY